MKKYKEKIPHFIFILLTVLNYILGVFFIDASHFLGASSTVQLFLFAVGMEKKYMLFLTIAYSVIFWFCMILSCITKSTQKRFIVFSILLLADIFISVLLTIFKLCVQNYLSIYAFILGILVRIAYALWAIIYTKTKTEKTVNAKTEDGFSSP